jgi:hypothetical protein
MLELCKRERGEKVVAKTLYRREKKKGYSWNFSKEKKGITTTSQRGKRKENAH